MPLRHRLLLPDLEYHPPPYGTEFCADFGVCPPPPDSSPDSVQIHIRRPEHHVTNLLIAAFSLLGAALIICAVIFFIIRRRRFRPAPPPPLQPPIDDPLLEPPVDHHIWNIRTVGLDASTIAAISTVRFKPSEGLIDGSDCAVCLGEFREGDELRLLPKCSHAFHIPCIDTWLRSRVSCPLCRAPIVASRQILPVSESIGLDLGSGDSSDTPMPDGDRIDGNEQEEGERMTEVVISSCSQGSRSGTLAPGDLQPVRRSVSMDDSSLGALLLRVQLEEKKGGTFEEESHHGNRRKQVGDVKGEIVRKRVVRRVRSLSTSGRWFNLSRIGRVGRSPVLPV